MNSNQNNAGTPNANSIEAFAHDLEHFRVELDKRLALHGSQASGQAAPAAPTAPSAPRPYLSEAEDEFTNACGELLDPLSVIRVTAHISAAHPFGSIASPSDQRFLDEVMPQLGLQRSGMGKVSGCMSLARLGSGDQTVLLPSVHSTGWIPVPGIYELELMKHAMPHVPSDVLVLEQFAKAQPEPAATPWLLRHLGLQEPVELDLHRVLASLKPVHQAFLMAAISRPDVEAALYASTAADDPTASAEQRRQGLGRSYVLRAGILAAMRLDEHELDRDEASLVRLGAVLADLGALNLPNKGIATEQPAASRLHEPDPRRCAHPDTVQVFSALLGRLEALEPEDAARLRALWSAEGEKEFRMGSRYGPLSKNPVDHNVARLGRALGDALARARDEYGIYVSVTSAVPSLDVGEIRPRGSHPAPAPMLQATGDAASIAPDLPDAQHRGGPKRVVLFPWSATDEEQDFARWGAMDDPNEAFPQEDRPLVPAAVDADVDSGSQTSMDAAGDEMSPTEFSSHSDPRPSLEWAAGMLDGDGCIAIVKQPFPTRRSIFRLIVTISQNCLQTLQHFQRCVNVPSTIYAVRRQLGHNKQVYTLNFTGPNAMRLVQLLKNYLVRKRQEATVALSFCELGQISRRFGRHGVPPAVESIRVAHYKKLRALK